MEGIAPFQSGRPLLSEITADKLNRILAEIKRNRPVVAAPLSARVTGDGTHISIKQTSGGGTSTPITRQPWDLIAQVDPDADPEDENPPYLVRVQPGTLNGILPSNWDEEFERAGTGLHYAKAVITTDGEAITGVTIAIDTTEPAAQEPQEFGIAAEVEYLFGLFAEGAVYRVIGAGHIVLPNRTWLVASAEPSASPGESPYDIYYVLGP
jgi:hypothetical protein